MARATMVSFMSSLIIATIFLSDSSIGLAQDCKSDVDAFTAQCLRYVTIDGPTMDPSSACCSAVKVKNIPCTCNSVTNETLKTVSMTKLVSVASKCGKPLAPGYKCGVYTVPKA